MQPTRISPESHGTGCFHVMDFRQLGKNVVIEPGVLAFHPENIEIGEDVYIGHNTILHCEAGAHLRIGSGTRIGPQCLLHASSDITIGDDVGIGSGVRILASEDEAGLPAQDASAAILPIVIGESARVGVGAMILRGASIGAGSCIEPGSVVAQDAPGQALGSRNSEAA